MDEYKIKTGEVGTRHGLNKILSERKKTHGDFRKQARTAFSLKKVMRCTPGWGQISPEKTEALDLIAVKISRILHGDPNHTDSWEDIAGYATLISRELKKWKR